MIKRKPMFIKGIFSTQPKKIREGNKAKEIMELHKKNGYRNVVRLQ